MRRVLPVLALAIAGWSMPAHAAQDPTRPIKGNQTDGYGNDRLVAFTYFMNFQCVHEPFDDLSNNGRPSAIDPNEGGARELTRPRSATTSAISVTPLLTWLPLAAAPVAVAVTIEPAGGVPAPTGERVLVGAP